ncbi:MAG TPA: acyl-ACP thioesterase domain-containing protein [Anaerolineaceae bacterium]|jgi:acyl-ACP thioesterase
MQIKTIWTEQVTVKSYETDFQERWRPACVFQVMQEAAAHHAAHLGFDYAGMLAAGRVWILSRVKVRFFALPRLQEKVAIRTWPKGIQQKVFFMRDFELTTADGKPVAAATSAWILINPTARRMLLPSALPVPVPDNEGLSALDDVLERIHLPAGLAECFQTRASYSSIDQMGHVNNARYIEWITDCFPFVQYSQGGLDWLQINFVNEVKPGEEVAVAAEPCDGLPGQWAVQGTNQANGLLAFEASLGWK